MNNFRTLEPEYDQKKAPGHSQNPDWEMSTAISKILEIAMKPISIVKQLEEILGVLTSISWLKMESRGAVFVTNTQKELVMIAQKGLENPLHTMCAKVPFGHCLCGKAAESKQLQYRNCVDSDHDIQFEGMTDHGHYSVPLFDNKNRIIGVLVLYLKVGHQPHPKEESLMASLGRTVSGIMLNRNLQLKADINSLRLQHAQRDILYKLVVASEFKDNQTGDHIKRVSLYAVALGKQLGLERDQLCLLEQATPMHDIGKIGISDHILLKPGALTDEEFVVMQEHTTIGANILSGTHPLIEASRQVALSHHEKWDGSGYPKGLKGEDIPLFGRICALVDVFDALSSDRPYKKSWTMEDTMAEIKRGSGTHFDPSLVKAFQDIFPEILSIHELYTDNVGFHCRQISENKLISENVPGWDASMSVGNVGIDSQHLYLVHLINQARKAIDQFKAKSLVKIILEMKSYAEVHFEDEEELMRQNGYPGLEGHIKIHQGFIKEAEMLLQKLEAAPLATTSDITDFLASWLINHILGADAKYGRFIKEKNQAVDTVLLEVV